MPRKILLPTLEAPGETGGIARYIEAIQKTFPSDVEVLVLNASMGRHEMASLIRTNAKGHRALWIHHILPIGTIAWLSRTLPYVIFLHGMDFDLGRRNAWKRWLTNRILRKAERIVTNSKALAKQVEAFAGRQPMIVYPCVADKLVENSGVTLRNSHRQGDRMTLLTVSRLVERKGHLHVLEVIKDLPDVVYRIVGDGSFRPEIEKRIQELGLRERVELLGVLEEDALAEAYRNADIFVMPTAKTRTDREGFGIVYLEAQLFELPVIASNHAGVDEAVMDKVTGYLVEDVPSLRGAIERLAEDPDLRVRMGKAGREFVLAGFTRDKQMQKLRKLLS